MTKTNYLTQNSELRADGIYNFTLPAFAVTLSNGQNFNVCPNAGACAQFCYARNGTYLFRNVKQKHMSNLEQTLHNREQWKAEMLAELQHKRFRPTFTRRTVAGLDPDIVLDDYIQRFIDNGYRAVRIHDSGDFYDSDYALAWIDIARQTPDVLFYAYTKEVLMFKDLQAKIDIPSNFRWLYSMGGKQDHLLDPDTDRHAEVFADIESIEQAGYMSQDESDLLAILLPTTRVGIPQNNIKHFIKRMAGRTFGELQSERREKIAAKNNMS